MLDKIKCPKCGSYNTESHAILTCNPPITQYKCNDCDHLFTLPREDTTAIDSNEAILTTPKPEWTPIAKYGWVCPRCGKVNSPFIDHCDCKPEEKSNYYPDWSYHPTITTPPSRNFNFTADACKSCSNNPANGGTGFCNCTLGTMGKVTCTVLDAKN